MDRGRLPESRIISILPEKLAFLPLYSCIFRAVMIESFQTLSNRKQEQEPSQCDSNLKGGTL